MKIGDKIQRITRSSILKQGEIYIIKSIGRHEVQLKEYPNNMFLIERFKFVEIEDYSIF